MLGAFRVFSGVFGGFRGFSVFFLFKQFTCMYVRVFHYQAGRRQERTRLTRFNPGCSGLQPEIRSTQFSEDQMPLSKELMHVVAGIYHPQILFLIFVQQKISTII